MTALASGAGLVLFSATAVTASALIAAIIVATAPSRSYGRSAASWLLAASGLVLAVWGALSLHGGASVRIVLPSPLPSLPFGLSPLAAGAAVLAGMLFAGSGLFRAAGHGAGGGGTVLLIHVCLLCVVWFLCSRAPLPLVAGWEAVSAASYLLLVRDPLRVRRAAWALLGLSEFGAFLLFFAMVALPVRPGGAWAAALAVLALFAFGAKAGLFPLQVWAPLAEPEAPGDVAGLFSGLLPAVAVVGYLQVLQWIGPTGLLVAAVTGLFGLAGAVFSSLLGLIERDAKRVLAYGTLEALGLVFTALGVGMALEAAGAGSAAVMAVCGALVLLAGHGAAKFVLFCLAGLVEERSGLRLLDRLGGLLRRQPRAAGPLLVAAGSLAGLPPFGVFLGEWLVIEACFASVAGPPSLHMALAVAAALIGLVSALAVTVYLRWIGTGWLGLPRTPAAASMTDASPLGAAALWLPTVAAAAAGVAAGFILPWAAGATSWLAAGQAVVAPVYLHPSAFAPIVALGADLFRGIAGRQGNVIFAAGGFNVGSPWDLAVFGALLGLAVGAVSGRRRSRVRRAPPWAGGEPGASPSFQWTAEGLNHPLRLSFATYFALRRERSVGGILPSATRYRSAVLLRLEHHIYRPLLAAAARAATEVRMRAQSGDLGQYVGYLLGAALVGLAAVAIWR